MKITEEGIEFGKKKTKVISKAKLTYKELEEENARLRQAIAFIILFGMMYYFFFWI